MRKLFTLFITLLILSLPGMSDARQAGYSPFYMQPEDQKELPGIKVRVYPNPATDFIRVEWETDQEPEVHAELYDLVGRRIAQHQSDNIQNRIQLDLHDLRKSAYLLKVYTKDGKFSRTYRIVKQ